MAVSLLRVKNWREFQHYQDGRTPNWIKLHLSLRADYEFTSLSDTQRFHLIGIWMLAATRSGAVPADARWIERQLMTSEKVDLAAFVRLGFLVSDEPILSSGPSTDTTSGPSTEPSDLEKKRGEKKQKRAEEMSPLFVQAWGLYPKRPNNSRQDAWKAWSARVNEGVSESVLVEATRAYAGYCLREGTEPRFVMMGATFYGPSRRFESDFGAPLAMSETGEVALYEADGVTLTEAGRLVLGL